MSHQFPMFPDLLRSRREDKMFLTQKELADRIRELAANVGKDCPCDQGTVSRWENGKQEPNVTYRRFIAEALEIDPEVLFMRAKVAA